MGRPGQLWAVWAGLGNCIEVESMETALAVVIKSGQFSAVWAGVQPEIFSQQCSAGNVQLNMVKSNRFSIDVLMCKLVNN